MQIVIDIEEEDRKDINNIHFIREDLKFKIGKAIMDGIPLPKGHGRLIDADKTELLSDLFCYTRYTGIIEAPYEDATTALDHAPTIIPADKE